MSATVEQRPKHLNILSLNCWGLKYISKYRRERLSEIGRQLSAYNPPLDIVGLQECWTQEDYQSILHQTSHILPYGKYYYSGIFGGGLVILSRWPIEESSMVRYPLNGRPTAFYRGDWFVGKGVACAKIRIGPSQKDVVEVFCTHLHAPYEKEPKDSYICHRTAQALEIAKLMRGGVERDHLVIGLGDFNMIPLSLAHRLIESHGSVRDIWRILHPDSSLGAARHPTERARRRGMPNVSFNLTENGVTCDSALNTWRWDKGRQRRLAKGEEVEDNLNAKDPRGKRLDYIFMGNPSGITSLGKWTAECAKVGMRKRHPALRCSLSDHYSVEVTLSRTTDGEVDHNSVDEAFMPSEDNRSKWPSDSTGRAHEEAAFTPLPINVYDEILAMTDKYTLRERTQRRLRLGHFGLSFAVSIGCFVAVWWSPRNFVSFLLMLLSTLGLSAGVIDGLIGGLFVGSELRAIKEFRWEISNAKEIAIRHQSLTENSSHELRA